MVRDNLPEMMELQEPVARLTETEKTNNCDRAHIAIRAWSDFTRKL